MTNYHFIGIGGIGMSALAHLLLDKQQAVSGSDLANNNQTTALKKKGAKVCVGHHADNVSSASTVVYSSDINASNPEYERALMLKCPILHRSELLAELMKGYTNLAVSGSHGKTTTSSLLAHVLIETGKDPSYALGGMLKGCNGRVGQGSYFVFEADESDGTFENYVPTYAIITNLDHEHLNHYGSLHKLQEACQRFCKKVSQKIFYCKDDPNLAGIEGISYGFHADSDICILKAIQEGFGQTITLRDREGKQQSFYLPLIGLHNARNAAAVFALVHHLGVEPAMIAHAIASFPGVGRRMQLHANTREILRLEDYAHHPSEIKTTLEGLKLAVGERRLVVLFQPHRFTRTKDHLLNFARSFDSADLVFVTDIYAAGESPIEGIDAQKIVQLIQQHSTVSCHYLPRQSWLEMNEILRPHDVFISMGAGDISTIHAGLDPHKKYRLGLIYGGRSCEHEISKRSAQFVQTVLDRNLYDVELFFIDKNGKWSASEEEEGSSFLSSSNAKRLNACDLFFPVLHGSFGEDGTLQGVFEILEKPYVGPDWCSAAISMNKMLSKTLAAAQGVSTPQALLFSYRQWQLEPMAYKQQVEQMRFPLFIKPNHLGSSVGISKIYTIDELEAALDKVFKVDTKVLVEESVEGAREIEFAVVGNQEGFKIDVPKPGEKLAQGQFVDYTLKYSTTPVATTVEPIFDPQVLQQGQEAALKVYQAIGCNGMTRVDFLLDPTNKWWFFELNPIPGMTSLSLFPKIWKREGYEPAALMNRLVILALERTATRKRYLNPCLV